MSPHRFFLPSLIPGTGSTLELPEDTARQVSRVLRLRLGDGLVVFDGSGSEWSAEIASVTRECVSVALGEPRDPGTEPDLQVTICQALVPAERMEFVIQKGTELGAAGFIPVITERVQAKDAGPTNRRLDRWRRIAIEAAEQSGRTRVPTISPVEAFESCVTRLCTDGPLLLLWEEEHGTGLRTAARESLSNHPGHVSVLVGPVGGLSEAEVGVARDAGAVVVGAGPRILRAETAPLVALSVLMYEAGELE